VSAGRGDEVSLQRPFKRIPTVLEDLNTPGSWKHISNQIGMFSFTGLKAEAVDALASKASIYM
jgi:aspartate/tyrosine/aromatic aminotransferase